MSALKACRRALASLIPPPRLLLSQWIEQHIVLPEATSALPGRVRLWPWQRDIADSISDPEAERVTLVKPTRVGFTTLLVGAVGSFVANEPAPILVLLPTESDARDHVVSDIEPVFEATPILCGTLSGEDGTGERNTLTARRFPGGSIKVLSARSPRNLRRHNARVLICDEADGMEITAEGNPLRLAERRTVSFANRKIIIGSTPLFSETSHVLRAYAESDQRVFECPCPACGGFTEIMWGHIEWQEGQPATAAFRCPHCAELVEERHKAAMVEQGRWRATRPDVRGHHGYRINALVSLLANATWAKLAAEFLGAKEDPAELQVFVNTILAQGWTESGEEIDDDALAARAEPFGLDRIPPEVLVLTAGVDVQDDRFETTIIGWTRAGEALVLGHIVTWGSPDDDLTWTELDDLLKTRWRHPLGGQLHIDAAVIDSGDGDWTDRVYSFCFPRASRRIMAGKGVAGTRPSIQASHGKVRGGRLWLFGTDTIKTTLFARLQRGQHIRFSDSLEPAYYEMLASEKRRVRYVRGKPVRRYERVPGRRAEALDCAVMAFAARSAAPIQLDQRETDLRSVVPPTRAPTIIRSQFMQGRMS